MKARKGPLQNRRESDIGRGVVAEVKGLPQIEDCRVGPLLPAGSRVSARRGDSQRETWSALGSGCHSKSDPQGLAKRG